MQYRTAALTFCIACAALLLGASCTTPSKTRTASPAPTAQEQYVAPTAQPTAPPSAYANDAHRPPTPAPQTDTTPLVTFHGTVLDAKTKQPVPYAEVISETVGKSNPSTDREGRFSFPIIADNILPAQSHTRFTLYANASNYSASSKVTVDVSDASEPVTISLTPESVPPHSTLRYPASTSGPSADGAVHITGRIVDAKTGQGVRGLTVVLETGFTTVRTDADGRYDILVPENERGSMRIFFTHQLSTDASTTPAIDQTYYQVFAYDRATTRVEEIKIADAK